MLVSEIHEIHPVKYGGDPTDPANKIPLLKSDHSEVSKWWEKLKRELE
jgi:hypothetical protein